MYTIRRFLDVSGTKFNVIWLCFEGPCYCAHCTLNSCHWILTWITQLGFDKRYTIKVYLLYIYIKELQHEK